MASMLSPIQRPVSASPLERMPPPGSSARLESPDEVVLEGRPQATPEVPCGPRGWRKAALIGAGVLSLAGGLMIGGPQVPALMVATQSSAELVAGMAHPGTSAQELKTLQKSLSPVDPQVLSLLSRNGLKVQVVHEGQDLAQTGILREQSPQDYERRKDEITGFVARLNQESRQRFDAPIEALEQERDRLAARIGVSPMPLAMAGHYPGGFGGFGGTPPQLTPDQQAMQDLNVQLGKLSADKNGFFYEQAALSDLNVKPFNYPVRLEQLGNMMGLMQMMHAQFPTSVHQMATVNGARTPEQVQEFSRLVEMINGERLVQAREHTLSQYQQGARAMGKPMSAATLAAARRHPEQIPIDHRRFNILVPDLIYTEVGGKVLRLDEHDWGTVQSWANPDGRLKSGKDAEGEPDGTMGQYFWKGGLNQTLIRDFRLTATTPVHEFGHALDFLVEKLDPAWHKTWYAEVGKAFDQVGREGGTRAITDYSRSNVREYIGDGFMLYHSEPEALKSKDPALYQRVEELLDKARELGTGRQATTLGQFLKARG